MTDKVRRATSLEITVATGATALASRHHRQRAPLHATALAWGSHGNQALQALPAECTLRIARRIGPALSSVETSAGRAKHWKQKPPGS